MIQYYTDRNITAEVGSGGDYLSNEIYYRVAFLRETLKPEKRTGHIHVGFLSKNKDGAITENRDTMLNIIRSIIKNKILPTL